MFIKTYPSYPMFRNFHKEQKNNSYFPGFPGFPKCSKSCCKSSQSKSQCKPQCKPQCKSQCKSSQYKSQCKKSCKCCKSHKKCCNDQNTNTNLVILSVGLNLSAPSLGLSIYGKGFLNVDKVTINSIVITNFMIIDDNVITVVLPSDIGTTLSIFVSYKQTNSNTVNYILPDGPVITSLSPSSGSMGPLMILTLSGSNLTTLRSIQFDNLTLSISNYPISIISDNMISFIMPYININDVTNIPITVTTLLGTSNTLNYIGIPAPTI